MRTTAHIHALIPVVLLFEISLGAFGFSTVGRPLISRRRHLNHGYSASACSSSSSSRHMLSADAAASSIMTSAVEFFDGSGITDSVVRSNSYWSNLQGQLGAFLLGQLTALTLFTIGASIVAQKAPQILEQVGNVVESRIFPKNENQTFQKLRVPPSMQSEQTSARQPEIQIDVQKLFICLAIDFLGSASELIPIYGEFLDIVYAPLAAYFLRSNFGGSNVAFALELAEEILPLTDILPFATICWIIDTFAGDSTLAKLLQLGEYRPQNDAIEVNAVEVQQDVKRLEGGERREK